MVNKCVAPDCHTGKRIMLTEINCQPFAFQRTVRYKRNGHVLSQEKIRDRLTTPFYAKNILSSARRFQSNEKSHVQKKWPGEN